VGAAGPKVGLPKGVGYYVFSKRFYRMGLLYQDFIESEDEFRLYRDMKLFSNRDFLDFKKTSVYLAV